MSKDQGKKGAADKEKEREKDREKDRDKDKEKEKDRKRDKEKDKKKKEREKDNKVLNAHNILKKKLATTSGVGGAGTAIGVGSAPGTGTASREPSTSMPKSDWDKDSKPSYRSSKWDTPGRHDEMNKRNRWDQTP